MATGETNKKLLTKKINFSKLIKEFKSSKENFRRVSLHSHNNSKMHIMIMFYKKYFSYPYHYSINKSETFIHIYGSFVIKTKENNKIKTYKLDGKNIFSYKIQKNIFHKIIPNSNVAVALEVLDGPYRKNSVKKL